MSETDKFFKLVQENEAKFVDFRFTDTKGKWQHTSFNIDAVSKDTFKNGVMFDGSSIAGWQKINNSDMILLPDAETACMDPFSPYPTVIITCDVVDPATQDGYSKDPRHTAKLAEEYLVSTGIGDTAYFGPELEFFIFDDVRFKSGMFGSFYEVDSEELPKNSDKRYEIGNMGHRPKVKGGYFPVAPVDSGCDIRQEMMMAMKDFGLKAILHHHEVAAAQHEMGFEFSTLTATGDNAQKYKYLVHNIAHSYGKTATFMPKPIYGDNGSGMHVHQSIWKDGQNIFAGNGYANLSEDAIYYIGGIIKHAKALNAFTNASTNSYKRLIPGFEAPTILAYSEKNRSAAIRIPWVASQKAKRVETRFPDPTANPYLAFSALLMAGLDGIQNKIHPGDADNRDLYELDAKELKEKPQVCRSLREALENLDADRDFLTKGGVFTDEQIDAYIELKMEEVVNYEHRPHPIEFDETYSC